MTNKAINQQDVASVDSLKFLKKRLTNYLTIGGIVLGTSLVNINSADAGAVQLINGNNYLVGGGGATEVNQASDTLSNSNQTATASVTIDGGSGGAVTFATLIAKADLILNVGIIDGNTGDAETTTVGGNITASAGSTLAITITDGKLILAGSVVEAGDGVSSIVIAAAQELNTTGGTKTFASAITGVATSTLNIDGAATFSDTVAVGVIDIDGATTFSGNVTATGAVTIDQHVTFAGDVTLSSSTETVLVGSKLITFTGGTFTATGANGIESQAANSGFFADGAGDQTIASQFTHDAVGELVVTNSNVGGTVTFKEKIGAVGGNEAKLIDTDTGTISVFEKEVATDLFTVDGSATLTLDNNEATRVDINGIGSLIISNTITDGQEVFTVATAVENDDIQGTGNIKMPGNLTDGQDIVLFAQLSAGNQAAVVVDTELALLDTALMTYTASNVVIATNDNNITVTASENSTAQVATNLGVTKNDGVAFKEMGTAVQGTDTVAFNALFNSLSGEGGLTAATDSKRLAIQAAPQTEIISGSTVASQGVTNSVQGIISNRMASLRSGDAFATGMSAGGTMSAKSGFVQVFGSTAEQKNRTIGSGIQSGFESDSSGVAIGFDGISDAGTTVGLSLSMSNTDVDSKGIGGARVDMDSYTASIYMDKATDVGYIEGSLTYGTSENSTSRKITAAGLNRTLTADYDSDQISLNIGVGMPKDVGMGFVTPFASVTGTTISTDSYTEKSTVVGDALRLKIAQDDVTSLVGSLGVKYHNVMDHGGTPMISFAVNNEFGDSAIDSTNTYQGGGTAFKTSTDVEALSATLGVGYSLGNDFTSIQFSYEADANDDKYLSHGGSIKVVGKF